MFYIKLYIFNKYSLSFYKQLLLNMAIITNIDVMLAKRKMSVTELADRVGITIGNISRLKKGNVKGIRYSTLNKICQILECKPGDLLDYKDDK